MARVLDSVLDRPWVIEAGSEATVMVRRWVSARPIMADTVVVMVGGIVADMVATAQSTQSIETRIRSTDEVTVLAIAIVARETFPPTLN